MSAAGRLSILGLAVAACLMPSTTSYPPHLPQQQGQGSNVSPSVQSPPAKSPEQASSFVEPTVVTLTDRPVKLPVALGQPLVPRGRNTIGHQLQEELRRVGCYGGELNGVWTTSTRRAMQEFLERVNAAKRQPNDLCCRKSAQLQLDARLYASSPPDGVVRTFRHRQIIAEDRRILGSFA
jgi:hypothetical protein